MGYIEYGYIGFSKAGVNHRICKNILLTKNKNELTIET